MKDKVVFVNWYISALCFFTGLRVKRKYAYSLLASSSCIEMYVVVVQSDVVYYEPVLFLPFSHVQY